MFCASLNLTSCADVAVWESLQTSRTTSRVLKTVETAV